MLVCVRVWLLTCCRQYRFRRDFTGGLGAGNVGMAGYGLTYLGDPTKGGVGQPMGVGGGSKVRGVTSSKAVLLCLYVDILHVPFVQASPQCLQTLKRIESLELHKSSCTACWLAPQVWSILSVLSTNSININGQMVLQQGDNTLCAGDSGSAALVQLLPASAAPTGTTGHVLLGVVHGGNSLCRATNTYTRSDSSK